MIRIKKKKVNPTDHGLLNEIEIVKKKGSIDKDFIFYNIFLNGKNIGGASVQKDADCITDVYVDKKYRLKGIGTFLYNYIENDLRIKLKPSGGKELKGHSHVGKLFWQNRFKKQNPTDRELIKQIRIESEDISDHEKLYKAVFKNNVIGAVYINPKKGYVGYVEINEHYRRKGVSSILYNYIENDLGIKLKPSENQSYDGKAFWKSRK